MATYTIVHHGEGYSLEDATTFRLEEGTVEFNCLSEAMWCGLGVNLQLIDMGDPMRVAVAKYPE